MPGDLGGINAAVDRDLAAKQGTPPGGGGASSTPPGPAAAKPAQPPLPPPEPGTLGGTARAMGVWQPAGGDGGVAGRWWTGLSQSVTDLTHPKPPDKPETSAQHAVAVARQVQTVVANVFSVLSVPMDMLNVGFATLTAPIAAICPPFPAATMGMMYLGVPHAHSHPPSLIPPAPPVPLPSLGAVMLGTCVRVLINGMPAARCGDIGLAPTCCGFFPFFQIKTGSSNTFIGGNRAARMLDVCTVCSQAEERKTVDAGKVMGAIGAAARGAEAAIKVGGVVVGALGMAADIAEEATGDDAAMASAKALSAGMAAAQMAADAAAMAMTKMMGKDPGIPPSSIGAITLGHPNVLIGGFPMVNIPNPVDLILGKLSKYKAKKPAAPAPNPEGLEGGESCPI